MLRSLSLTFQFCLICIHANPYYYTSSFTLCLCMFEMHSYFLPNNVTNSRWLELEYVQKVYINVPITLNNLRISTSAVLSKNPIRKIGDALLKVQSITKVRGAPICWTPLMPISVLYSYCSWNLSWFQLSLSHCQLQGIDTSLKSCVELSELRLAHNEIKVCF